MEQGKVGPAVEWLGNVRLDHLDNDDVLITAFADLDDLAFDARDRALQYRCATGTGTIGLAQNRAHTKRPLVNWRNRPGTGLLLVIDVTYAMDACL